MKIKLKKKESGGITLIALVVTVIVLLILAGVSINMIIGSNGIISKAAEAKFKTEIKALQEETIMYIAGNSFGDNGINKTEINAGYENLINLKYIDEEESEGGKLNTILSNVPKEYEDQIVIYKGEFYYIHNNKKTDREKVKWCFDIGVKVWGYETWEDFVDQVINRPEPEDPENYNEDGTYKHDGSYKKINGIYMCTPDLTGFYQLSARYIKWDENGNQEIGTWTVKKPDKDWYDYKNKNWANVLVENDGKESYFVWIPRYMYKTNSAEQTVDVKFVDLNNNHTEAGEDDAEDKTISYEELLSAGYKLPESFAWGDNDNLEQNTQLSGYWISKYEISEIGGLLLDMDLAAGETSVKISNVRFPSTDKLKESQVKTYSYYLNAEWKKDTTSASEEVVIGGLKAGNQYTINLTAKDKDGNVLASMTKTVKTSSVNGPNLTGYNPNTTFYVTWDEDGNEHNEIPISKDPPEEWYNYGEKKWANIVTRNNGKESYFVWIPRYEYRVMNSDRPVSEQYMDISFIPVSQTGATEGYKIPESFAWGDNADWTQNTQLSGYWISKYEIQDEAEPAITADIGINDTSVKISNIRGTGISGTIIYEYYLDGVLKNKSETAGYIYEGLVKDRNYTINVIAKKKGDNSYIGAVTKEIITVGANEPDLTGYNPNTTYYVTWKSNGDEVRTPITEQKPSDWYDYADKKWANIVTVNEGKEAYFVWIPRYAYKTMYGSLPAYQHIDIAFIRNKSTEEPLGGYKMPESFAWGDNTDWKQNTQLSGYWISKYEIQN